MNTSTESRLAVLIDADNISPALANDIFRKVYAIGTPIARRAYGMVNCFSSDGGWSKALREFGVVARPQVSNIPGKNVADIAALQCQRVIKIDKATGKVSLIRSAP